MNFNRAELLKAYPPEGTWLERIYGTDGEKDFDALWSVCKHFQPKSVVELGTREAVSTLVLRLACPTAKITTIDIDPRSAKHVIGLNVSFLNLPAEQAFWSWNEGPVDLLFIDTDPHSYMQTKMWLDTWVSRYLNRSGIALFHDTLSDASTAGDPIDSEVGRAVKDWCHDLPYWHFDELGDGHGLGALRFMPIGGNQP